MIITISGTAGSGKSVTAKLLAQKLGYKHYSVGDYRRKMAESKGIDINELNKLGEKDFSTDEKPDAWQTNLGKTKDNFVIDSRLGFHFIPESFKIFLDADVKLRAERIFKAKRDTENYKDLDDSIDKVKKRYISDKKRYEKYYSFDPFKKENFDLVIDTTGLDVEETVKKVLDFIKD